MAHTICWRNFGFLNRLKFCFLQSPGSFISVWSSKIKPLCLEYKKTAQLRHRFLFNSPAIRSDHLKHKNGSLESVTKHAIDVEIQISIPVDFKPLGFGIILLIHRKCFLSLDSNFWKSVAKMMKKFSVQFSLMASLLRSVKFSKGTDNISWGWLKKITVDQMKSTYVYWVAAVNMQKKTLTHLLFL